MIINIHLPYHFHLGFMKEIHLYLNHYFNFNLLFYLNVLRLVFAFLKVDLVYFSLLRLKQVAVNKS